MSFTYQVLVWPQGSVSQSTGAVAYTLQATLGSVPIVASPIVRPLEGRTESVGWTVDVVDSSGGFTALLSSGGKLATLNRRALARISSGGSFRPLGGGRITDVSLLPTVAGYQLRIVDEGVIGRSTRVFTTNTTRVYPGGPHVTYGPWSPPPKGSGRVMAYHKPSSPTRHLFYLEFDNVGPALSDLGDQAISADLKTDAFSANTTGNFKYLRCRVGASTYPVHAIGATPTTINLGGGIPVAWNPHRLVPDQDLLVGLSRHRNDNQPFGVWVVAPGSSSFGLASSNFGPFGAPAKFSSAFVHMFSAPPSDGTPLHIGGTGEHPMALKKRLWDGSYQSTGVQRSIYSTAAFDNGSTGLTRNPMPNVRFRVTEPADRSDWEAQHLNAPFGVVDFVSSSGVLYPKRLWMHAASGFSSTGLTELTAATLRQPHPDWLHPIGESVTALDVWYTEEAQLTGPIRFPPGTGVHVGYPTESNVGADLVRATRKSVQRTHYRADTLGHRHADVEATGLHVTFGGSLLYPFFETIAPIDAAADRLASETFNRFGDGPVFGSVSAMSAGAAIAPGQFFKITLATYPNPALGTRGGTRIVQAMGKRMEPQGPVIDYLDAGPDSQPLNRPTLSLALSTQDKKHSIKATVGGISTAGALGWDLELAKSTAATAPTSGSILWQPWQSTTTTTIPQQRSSGTATITRRGAGSKTWARVRATKPGRFPSNWRVSTAGITTSGLAAPTISGTTGTKAYLTNILWANTNNGSYPCQWFADTSTSASLSTGSTGNLAAMVPAGQTRLLVRGLNPNQKHLLAGRYVDQYGGVGTVAKTTVTTLTTASTANLSKAPAMGGLYVQVGY